MERLMSLLPELAVVLGLTLATYGFIWLVRNRLWPERFKKLTVDDGLNEQAREVVEKHVGWSLLVVTIPELSKRILTESLLFVGPFVVLFDRPSLSRPFVWIGLTVVSIGYGYWVIRRKTSMSRLSESFQNDVGKFVSLWGKTAESRSATVSEKSPDDESPSEVSQWWRFLPLACGAAVGFCSAFVGGYVGVLYQSMWLAMGAILAVNVLYTMVVGVVALAVMVLWIVIHVMRDRKPASARR
ncbi:MAG: hypothetical protein ABIJ46_00920 [bacterium]